MSSFGRNIKAELEGMAAEHEEAMNVERLWNVVKEGSSKSATASLDSSGESIKSGLMKTMCRWCQFYQTYNKNI